MKVIMILLISKYVYCLSKSFFIKFIFSNNEITFYYNSNPYIEIYYNEMYRFFRPLHTTYDPIVTKIKNSFYKLKKKHVNAIKF